MKTKGYSIKYNDEATLNATNDMVSVTHNINFYQPQEVKIPFKGNSLTLFDDDKKMIFCSVEGRVAVYNRLKKEIISDVQLPGGGLYTLVLYQNEKYFFVGGKEGIIRQFLLADFKEVRQWLGHTNKISEIFFSKDETQMYSCSDDSTVRIWNINVGDGETEDKILYKHERNERSLCMDLSPDGRYMATGGSDRLIHVYDFKEEKLIARLEEFTNSCWVVKISRKTTLIMGGDNDGNGFIWEFGT